MDKFIDTKAALRHFKAEDPNMYKLFNDGLKVKNPITIPTPKASRDYFESIVSSIVSQQISTKAASAVRGRVVNLLGSISPESINAVNLDELKSCGLSSQKVKYITYNAKIWHEIPYRDFVHMTDEEIITELTRLYGIGRWTAEMFLIFSLGRPDVFSFGDLGLLSGLYVQYDFRPHYRQKIKRTVLSWSPHRTCASLALWYWRDNVPAL